MFYINQTEIKLVYIMDAFRAKKSSFDYQEAITC